MRLARLATGAVGLFAALAWQPAALAASLDISAFGSFQNISAGPEASYRVQNNDQVTDALLLWGAAGSQPTSRLGFDGLGSTRNPSHFSADIGTAFRIGEFSWLNGTSGHYKTNVNALDLSLSVQLAGGALSEFVFGITLENTRDESSRKGDPDHLKLLHDFGGYRFSVGSQDYVLDFLGLSIDQGASFTDRLKLEEGHKLKAGLYALISSPQPPPHPQAVPVPAAVWLFGSGLAALAGLARRRG